MKSSSVDVRASIVEAPLQQAGSIRQLAQRFTVSARFVWALLHRFHQTGSYAPKPHGGGNPAGMHPSQHEIITEFVKQSPDVTRKELCQHVEATGHVTPSQSSRQRVLAQLQLTRKKDTACDRA